MKHTTKPKALLTRLYKKAVITLVLSIIACAVFAQQKVAANIGKPQKASFSTATAETYNAAAIKRDTIECLFHQLINDNRPLLTWRKGFVVLEDEKLLVGDQTYPKSQASYITGMIKNQFLYANKKKPVTKKVVQLVLLQ
jgi:hypothetical protein